MNISFTSSFEKDLRKVREISVRRTVLHTIKRIEAAQQPGEIAGLKKLKIGSDCYRLRIGDYRLGVVIENDNVKFVRFLHRSEIYRFFP